MQILIDISLKARGVTRFPWWLLVSLIAGWLLVGHGCHGPEDDHELCVPFAKSESKLRENR